MARTAADDDAALLAEFRRRVDQASSLAGSAATPLIGPASLRASLAGGSSSAAYTALEDHFRVLSSQARGATATAASAAGAPRAAESNVNSTASPVQGGLGGGFGRSGRGAHGLAPPPPGPPAGAPNEYATLFSPGLRPPPPSAAAPASSLAAPGGGVRMADYTASPVRVTTTTGAANARSASAYMNALAPSAAAAASASVFAPSLVGVRGAAPATADAATNSLTADTLSEQPSRAVSNMRAREPTPQTQLGAGVGEDPAATLRMVESLSRVARSQYPESYRRMLEGGRASASAGDPPASSAAAPLPRARSPAAEKQPRDRRTVTPSRSTAAQLAQLQSERIYGEGRTHSPAQTDAPDRGLAALLSHTEEAIARSAARATQPSSAAHAGRGEGNTGGTFNVADMLAEFSDLFRGASANGTRAGSGDATRSTSAARRTPSAPRSRSAGSRARGSTPDHARFAFAYDHGDDDGGDDNESDRDINSANLVRPARSPAAALAHSVAAAGTLPTTLRRHAKFDTARNAGRTTAINSEHSTGNGSDDYDSDSAAAGGAQSARGDASNTASSAGSSAAPAVGAIPRNRPRAYDRRVAMPEAVATLIGAAKPRRSLSATRLTEAQRRQQQASARLSAVPPASKTAAQEASASTGPRTSRARPLSSAARSAASRATPAGSSLSGAAAAAASSSSSSSSTTPHARTLLVPPPPPTLVRAASTGSPPPRQTEQQYRRTVAREALEFFADHQARGPRRTRYVAKPPVQETAAWRALKRERLHVREKVDLQRAEAIILDPLYREAIHDLLDEVTRQRGRRSASRRRAAHGRGRSSVPIRRPRPHPDDEGM